MHDPEAPIASIADYSLVADLMTCVGRLAARADPQCGAGADRGAQQEVIDASVFVACTSVVLFAAALACLAWLLWRGLDRIHRPGPSHRRPFRIHVPDHGGALFALFLPLSTFYPRTHPLPSSYDGRL